MQVRFFASLRHITRCAEADIPYRETAGALAHSLCDLYGEQLRQLFFPSGEEKFGTEVIFLINGRHFNQLGGLDAPLSPGDLVDFFPVVSGG